jgi:HK97 family phage prohead protease
VFPYFEGVDMNFQHNDDVEMRVSPLSEVRFAAGLSTGEIAGYASPWGVTDSYGTVFAKGAFSESLAEHSRENTSPVMLWAHNKSDLIGKWTSVREDDRGLFVEGKINLETTRGREAFSHLKAGDLSGLSVGVFLDRKAIKPNGDGTSTIQKADLFEVSVVGVPANKRARITQVRSLQNKVELIELLRESGLPKAAAVRVAAAGWAGLANQGETELLDLAERLDLQTQSIRSMK